MEGKILPPPYRPILFTFPPPWLQTNKGTYSKNTHDECCLAKKAVPVKHLPQSDPARPILMSHQNRHMEVCLCLWVPCGLCVLFAHQSLSICITKSTLVACVTGDTDIMKSTATTLGCFQLLILSFIPSSKDNKGKVFCIPLCISAQARLMHTAGAQLLTDWALLEGSQQSHALTHPGSHWKGGFQWHLENGTVQFLAWHCFIDIGSIYCFLPPPKDDFGEWEA